MNTIVLHNHYGWVWDDPNSEFEPPIKEAWDWFKKADKDDEGDIHIFEDLLLRDHANPKYDGKIKIAAIYECPEIYKVCNHDTFNPFTWIKENYKHFDYVMSPYFSLKELFGDKFLWVPALSSRVKRSEISMYEKSKNISMIASFKDWTYGHKLRHEVIKKYESYFDVYGSGYNNIINEYGKLITIAPYYYGICILNSIEEDLFTEALTDLFAVGTIPIIFGTKNIAKYWNQEGFFIFDTIEELGELLPKLTPELYQSKIEAVKENVEITKKYLTIPDFIYENYKEILETL
jgi:hypothetical protein